MLNSAQKGPDDSGYWEAQIYKHPSVADIDKVYFKKSPSTKLKKLLDYNGIDYEVVS